jgi:hypothetical protein
MWTVSWLTERNDKRNKCHLTSEQLNEWISRIKYIRSDNLIYCKFECDDMVSQKSPFSIISIYNDVLTEELLGKKFLNELYPWLSEKQVNFRIMKRKSGNSLTVDKVRVIKKLKTLHNKYQKY